MSIRSIVILATFGWAIASAEAQSIFDLENARIANEPAPAKNPRPANDIPHSTFALSKENGPIMIKVASFIGDEHRKYAEALCQELRQRHKMNAYIHAYRFELEDSMTQEESRMFAQKYVIKPRRRVPLNAPPVNWVVLVGDFPSIEDSQAQRTLKKIRRLEVESVPDDIWALYRMSAMDGIKNSVTRNSPFSAAMIVLNPHPEAPKFQKQITAEAARMISELNVGQPFSVYENPQPYTLAVAQFQGTNILGETEKTNRFGKGILFGEKSSPLQQAAQQAISLAEALRQLGWEAYVFHGQYASLVCVGGFADAIEPDDPRFRDLRVRLQLANLHHNVVEMRERLAEVKIGGMTLSPHAELILTPRPPAVAGGSPIAN